MTDSFLHDLDRARMRIRTLEAEADACTHTGREVMAGVSRRTARLLRALWGVD
ncbi:MAG: hypothetical protein WC502_09160 [Methanolinea sp.]|jgi:hypothetical protein